MTKISHLITGFVIGAFAGFNPVFSMIGSVLPDKDLILQKTFNPDKKSLLFSHRGFTHHFALIPLFLILSFYLKERGNIEYFVASVLFGYVVHLITDTLTPLGIPYKFSYYPRITFKLFKTGSFLEYVFISIFVLVVGIYIYFNPEILKSLSKNFIGG